MSAHQNRERKTATQNLVDFIREHPRLTILTGAGCSTESGIPEYRDDEGKWKYRQPMQYADFVGAEDKRRQYWAQSFAGWRRISNAQPNAAHRAIAKLEFHGFAIGVITQNVDSLHTAAGSRNVIDLHGVLQRIRCLDCSAIDSRVAFQERLRVSNRDWSATVMAIAPDGDARISADSIRSFDIPGCLNCGGIVKPDVVFFGEPVPQSRISKAKQIIRQSDALLVVGSSLMVFSGFRFARYAHEFGIPIAIVNRGATRADTLATQKLTANCAPLLSDTVSQLAA